MTQSDLKTRPSWVWRISSVLLLTLWALLAAAPFAQAEPDRDASLPACCRTHGAHHCTGVASQTNEAPAFTPASLHEKCPSTPASGSIVSTGSCALTERTAFDAPAFAEQTLSSSIPKADEHESTAANPKRGPPSSLHLR